MEKKLVIPFQHKTVTLTWQEDLEINEEEILSIDYANIIGELLTFPVMFNRIGVLKAEVEYLLRTKKLDTDIQVSIITKQVRSTLATTITGRVTDKQVLEDVEISQAYLEAKMALFEVMKQAEIIDSLYWSAKSKDKKIEVLSAKIKPEEYEQNIMEGSVNGIMVKYQKNLIG